MNNKTSNGLDNGLAPNRRQAIIWTDADPIHWRIYTALGGDKLMEVYSKIKQMNTSQKLSSTNGRHFVHV